MAYIITASGRKFFPLSPTTDMVSLLDIASHLSKACRWTGAITGDEIYSVAQHAVLASMLVEIHTNNLMAAFDALHHDDSEAYLVDVARPLKYTEPFKSTYMKFEEELTEVIYRKFGIPWNGSHHPEVKIADSRMLATEARDIMPTPDVAGGWEVALDNGAGKFQESPVPYDFVIEHAWSPFQARTNYLDRHFQLLCRIKLAEQTQEGELVEWRSERRRLSLRGPRWHQPRP